MQDAAGRLDGAGRPRFGQHPDPDLLEDHRQRVQHQQLFFGRAFERRHRIEDRRQVEQHLGDDDPDDRDVTEAYVEDGEGSADRGGEDEEEGERHRQQQPGPRRVDAEGEDEDEDDDQVESEVEGTGENRRQRDHQPRELGLADHPLLGDDRGDRVRRRFLEEGEEDDPQQQHHRVVLDLFAADPEDLGEDEEEDAEQHQRPDQRPEVAEHGAEVDPLELGHRDQPEQVEEALSAATEGGGAGHLSQFGGRRRLAHGALPSITVVVVS